MLLMGGTGRPSIELNHNKDNFPRAAPGIAFIRAAVDLVLLVDALSLIHPTATPLHYRRADKRQRIRQHLNETEPLFSYGFSHTAVRLPSYAPVLCSRLMVPG